ncbi:MAG: citrate/2-methylcitrate synthase [Eubacteriaceae bacterium]|nr:citrate/2-methylcitrate synthase [Eubacteriaceae bacterium]
MKSNITLNDFTQKYADICEKSDKIPAHYFDEYEVNRGLRDKTGKGVLVGLTGISRVEGSKMIDGIKTPCEGNLWYRGYNIKDLVKNLRGKRYGFEEIAYLLLFGELPTVKAQADFNEVLVAARSLPTNFTRDVIMKAPTKDLMNSMTRSVLTLASYDDRASSLSLDNVLRQCIALISEFPMLAVYGFHAYNHYLNDQSLYIHRPKEELSTAENILQMLRPDQKYTELEAHVLDLALILHMEHGGGNNSTFTTRLVSSAGSDTYSVIAAALSSLKGPKHGGANIKVVDMMADIKAHVSDTKDEEAIGNYLEKILNKEAFDHKGLIYGLGHAVYSLSDPRARIFRSFVEELSVEKGLHDEYNFYTTVESKGQELITKNRKIYKGVCVNVDFFSGFVYSMLGIPKELFTPMFAIARIVGWSAHRIEELVNTDKIMRPAYQSIMQERTYVDFSGRS